MTQNSAGRDRPDPYLAGRVGRAGAPGPRIARRIGEATLLLAVAVALLAGCVDRPTRSGLPDSPRAIPPPVLEDTPRNPAATGGQRADVRRDAWVPA